MHQPILKFSWIKIVIIPILLWIVLTPWFNRLDLSISQYAYQTGSFSSHPFFKFLYDYALWPVGFVMSFAFVGIVLSFFNGFNSWRKPCLFLFLVFIIGNEVIINLALKDHWGRPRPKQITLFGGSQSFRSYYQPNFWHQPEPSKSFPCGHCALGFYFFSVAILGKLYQSRRFYYLGMGFALAYGGLLSFARIVQGGHFLSDTLASALIMWFTAWGIAYFLFIPNVIQKLTLRPSQNLGVERSKSG